MLNQFSRTQLLLGKEAMDRLKGARVAVFGIGGVGGYVCEALVRSGVGAIDLIDDDKVCLTNLNRQIIATRKTIGKYKTDVMEERIHDINPDVSVVTHRCFFLPENADEFPFEEYDYIVDAVDTVTAKIALVMKAQEFEESGLSFDEVVKQTEEYISSMNTFFVLETLDTLRKAGRLSNLKAFVASTLNIKPVMGSTDEGSIQQLGQARGIKRALAKMVEDVVAATKDCEHRILAISHCNCPERAQYVKACLEKLARFKKIVIVDTAGISSMYANDGGIIIAV